MDSLAVTVSFQPEDLAAPRQAGTTIPTFWPNLSPPPELHDLLRIAGKLYRVMARVWEHDGTQRMLVIYLALGLPAQDVVLH